MRRLAKVRVWRERAPARKGPAGAPAESRGNFALLSLGAPSLLICVHLSGPRTRTQSEPEFLDSPLLLASGLAYSRQLSLAAVRTQEIQAKDQRERLEPQDRRTLGDVQIPPSLYRWAN